MTEGFLTDDRLRGWAWLRGRSTTALWMTIVLVALVIFFTVITPNHAFFQLSAFQAIGRDAAIGILLAVGMTYVLASGQLDLSLGANLVLSSVVGAKVMAALAAPSSPVADNIPLNLILGFIAAALVGTSVGLINGWLVSRARVNSFITTLATTGIASGVTLVVAGGADIPGVPREVQIDFGVINILGVPVTIWIVAPVVATLWIALLKTRFGMRTLAIGSASDAALRAGINVKDHLLKIFILSGFLAGMAGFLDITRFGSTNILGHSTDSLAAIAAAVIGGTSLFGGKASIGGSITGAFIPIVLGTGLVIAGLPFYYQQAAVGLILLVAVYLDQRRRERSV